MTLDPCIVDSPTIDLGMNGGSLEANLNVSPDIDNGLEQRANGVWVPGRGYGASFPAAGTEYNGQVFFITAGTGVTWQFRYNLDSGLARKWEFIGGASLFAAVETSTSQTSDATPAGDWGNGAGGTPGPDLVVPLTGLYDVQWEVSVDLSNLNAGSINVGVAQGIGANPVAGLQMPTTNSWQGNHSFASQRVTLTGGTVLRMRYRNNMVSTTATYYDRRLRITPVQL